MPLPPLPKVELREVSDLTPPAEPGFLRLRRRKLVASYADGTESEPFVYDDVQRRALDAVVIAAHYLDDGVRWVYLRSAIRPPLRLRPMASRPFAEKESLGSLWELPAGLVEPSECSSDGLRVSAMRELHEELGFDVTVERMLQLGPSSFPAPGVIGERHHYFHVEVAPADRGRPTEDGSVLERNALIVAVALDEALELARRGEIEDAKSEMGLRRLAEIRHG
jgi:ADP-ribose pyrophosphatase